MLNKPFRATFHVSQMCFFLFNSEQVLLNFWVNILRLNVFQILPGNNDPSTIVSHHLNPPIFASQVRVVPHSFHRRTVCMRMELRGCPSDSEYLMFHVALLQAVTRVTRVFFSVRKETMQSSLEHFSSEGELFSPSERKNDFKSGQKSSFLFGCRR